MPDEPVDETTAVPETPDEATLTERMATVRDLAVAGPLVLGGLVAHSLYRSTCEGRAFYVGESGPAHAADLMVVVVAALLSWEVPEPVVRAGLAAVLVSQALRWRWTFT